jgi:hypothetical protein
LKYVRSEVSKICVDTVIKYGMEVEREVIAGIEQ